MDPDYWRQRWQEGRTAWNEKQPNALLVRHATALDRDGPPRRVLVPLCGKSVDVAWLASRGSAVVGVELVEDAVRAFFDERSIAAERIQADACVRYQASAGGIELVVANIFDATRERIGSFDAVYDRAALVALPPELRVRYVAHVRSLLDPGGRVLLVTVEHDAAPGQPPFAVFADEVRALWSGARVDLLEQTDQTQRSANLTARGARTVRELAWKIELPRGKVQQ